MKAIIAAKVVMPHEEILFHVSLEGPKVVLSIGTYVTGRWRKADHFISLYHDIHVKYSLNFLVCLLIVCGMKKKE